ncbi:hypothetical protein [Undibacterium sp. Ji49W]|uniref:hypothetical protein n=1 Tax=Undibacterium sp. Ji49W TaxID=3413040 RepID=UPI003BF323D5
MISVFTLRRPAGVAHAFALLACMLLSLIVRTAHADTALGMVLDVQGNGRMEVNGTSSKLQLLAYLQPKMQITVDAGSRVSLSLYATRSVYQVTGPAQVSIEKEGVVSLQGQKAVVRPMAEKLVRAAETSNVIAGAVRMRQLPPRIAITAPENNSLLLGDRPVFSWMAAEAAEFDISIQAVDEKLTDEKPIVRHKLKENNWQLPDNIRLEEGRTYRWQVSYVSARDGKTQLSRAEFRLASKSEAAALTDLRPDQQAAVEEWVLYAATLQGKRAYAESRLVWQIIARQRPDLARFGESGQ